MKVWVIKGFNRLFASRQSTKSTPKGQSTKSVGIRLNVTLFLKAHHMKQYGHCECVTVMLEIEKDPNGVRRRGRD